MSALRSKLIRLASTLPAGSQARKELLKVLAGKQASDYAAIFDALRPGQSVYVAVKSVMGMSDVLNGKPMEWKVGRRSVSKKYGVETIPLLPLDGSKPHKMNQILLLKRGEKVSAALGNMWMELVSLKLHP